MADTFAMAKKPINEVLASNLAHFMTAKGLTQAALGEKCDIGQTTISLYLNPDRRKLGASGKAPSAKLSEVEMLAAGLGVDVWQLLRALPTAENDAYERDEADSAAELANLFRKLPHDTNLRHLIFVKCVAIIGKHLPGSGSEPIHTHSEHGDQETPAATRPA